MNHKNIIERAEQAAASQLNELLYEFADFIVDTIKADECSEELVAKFFSWKQNVKINVDAITKPVQE